MDQREDNFMIKPDTHTSSGKISERPLLVFLICLISIFFSEVVVMIIISFLSPLDLQKEAFLDAILLTCLVTPLLYLFVYKPIQLHVRELGSSQEALKLSESRFRDVAENALEWIWEVDPQGKYTYASHAVEKILGYKPDEVIGKHFYDFFHPEDREDLKTAALNVFKTQQPFRDFINRNIHKNGEIVWLSTSGVPFIDRGGNLLGYRGSDADITERKQAEQKLMRAQEEWKETFNTIPDLILVTDNEHKIVNVNKAMVARLAASRDDLIGRSCYEVVHGTGHPPSYCPHSQTLSDGKEHIGEIYEDVLRGHFLVSSTPLYDAHQKPYGVVEVARDITKLKKLEEELQKAAITDELTGLYNRRGFTLLSEQQINVAVRNKSRLALLYADLDNMKQINDRLGHEAGDKALVDTAAILRSSFRRSDIIGRIGGDEFAVLLTGVSNTDNVIVDNLLNNLHLFNEQNDGSYELSISIGLAQYDHAHPLALDGLLAGADRAMYEQKKRKRE